MNKNHTSRRRAAVTTALAAFGVASLGLMGSAFADPSHDHDRVHGRDGVHDRDGYRDRDRDRDRDGLVDRHEDDRGYDYDDYDEHQVGPYGQYQGDVEVDVGVYGELDRQQTMRDFKPHARADLRQYDQDRSGRLDAMERQAYWRHLAQIGVFGRSPVTNEIGNLAKALDRDGDGRLTRREVTLVRRFIAARQMFEVQDRDNDNRLYRNETQGWLRNQFARLDRDRDRTLTRSELRQHFVRMDSDRPRVWSWSTYR